MPTIKVYVFRSVDGHSGTYARHERFPVGDAPYEQNIRAIYLLKAPPIVVHAHVVSHLHLSMYSTSYRLALVFCFVIGIVDYNHFGQYAVYLPNLSCITMRLGVEDYNASRRRAGTRSNSAILA